MLNEFLRRLSHRVFLLLASPISGPLEPIGRLGYLVHCWRLDALPGRSEKGIP